MSVSRDIVTSEMRTDELEPACELLGLAYRDNPMMFELYGPEPEVRVRTNVDVFSARMRAMQPAPIVVRDGGRLIGVCGFDPPGGSRMTNKDMAKVMAALSAVSADAPRRLFEMLAEWGKKTPAEPHWNLGPVGVDVDHQGLGIGKAMVTAFCDMVDAEHAPAFLETDLEKNARLYAKFGFETLEQATILGLPMWFMWRPAR
jgi:RimJ/RimL family protein N-acetyltransferase